MIQYFKARKKPEQNMPKHWYILSLVDRGLWGILSLVFSTQWIVYDENNLLYSIGKGI